MPANSNYGLKPKFNGKNFKPIKFNQLSLVPRQVGIWIYIIFIAAIVIFSLVVIIYLNSSDSKISRTCRNFPGALAAAGQKVWSPVSPMVAFWPEPEGARAKTRIYRNGQYGFEAKISPTMEAADMSVGNTGYLNFTDNSGNNLKVSINKLADQLTLNAYLKESDQSRARARDSSLAVQVKNTWPINIAGTDGVRRVEALGEAQLPAESVYFIYAGQVFQISVWVNPIKWQTDYVATGQRPTEVDPESIRIFDDFINSFRFINQ